MTPFANLELPIAALWCFGLTTVSAVVPWVNAEVIVLSLPAIAPSRWALVGLLGVATAGQMAGKCVVYWASRKGLRAPSPALKARLDACRQRFERHAWGPGLCVLVSSITGLPPFYLTTMAAGALRVNFAVFLVAGTAGRLVRFGSLVLGVEWVLRAA
jgi:membrane protein YqaA with SNARE-associated domain